MKIIKKKPPFLTISQKEEEHRFKVPNRLLAWRKVSDSFDYLIVFAGR